MRGRALCLAAALLAAACTAAGPERVARGDRVDLYHRGDGAEGLLVEADRLLVETASTIGVPLPPGRLPVRLFRSTAELEAFLSRECPPQAGRPAACFFDGRELKIALLHRGGEETRRLLRHEIVHYLLASAYTDVPPWIDEGLAKHLAGGGVEGAVDAGKVPHLLSLPPGAELDSPDYDLAAALVEELLERGGYDAMRCYLAAVRSDGDGEQTFRRCFGLSSREAALLLDSLL